MFITPSFKKGLIVAKNNFKGITLKKNISPVPIYNSLVYSETSWFWIMLEKW